MSGAVNFPLPPAPLVDSEGRITRPWLYLLQQFFSRTGGAPGINSGTLAQQINNLAVETAFEDVLEPIAADPWLSGAMDAPDVPAQRSGFLDAIAAQDDAPPRPEIALVAMLVSDVS